MSENFPESIEQWRSLDSRDREFYVWQTLKTSSDFLNVAEKRFASKWVERVLVVVFTGVGMTLVYAILDTILKKASASGG